MTLARGLFVLDTCVLVSAIRSQTGASRYLVSEALSGNLRIGLSTALLYQYEEVLGRSDVLPWHIEQSEICTIVDALLSVAKQIKISYSYRPSIRDEGDECIVEAAYSGGASIVTNNTRDFEGCERLGVKLYKPGDLAKILKPAPGGGVAEKVQYPHMAELMPSLRRAVERIAERENCSVDELINLAVAEKVAASDAEYLLQRKQAAQGKAKQGLYSLARIAGTDPPVEGDEMPASTGSAPKTLFAGGGHNSAQ